MMDAWLRHLTSRGLVAPDTAWAAMEAAQHPVAVRRPVTRDALVKLAAAAEARWEALTHALRAMGAAEGPELEEELEAWRTVRRPRLRQLRALLEGRCEGAIVAAWTEAVLERLEELAPPARLVAVDQEAGLAGEPPGAVAITQAVDGSRELVLLVTAPAATLHALARRALDRARLDAPELATDAVREMCNVAAGRALSELSGVLEAPRPLPPQATAPAVMARSHGTALRGGILTAAGPLEAGVWLG